MNLLRPLILSAAIALLVHAPSCKKREPASAPDSPRVVASDPGPQGGNLLKNSTFDDGTSLPWMTSFSPPASGEARVQDGALCLTIDHAGSNKWDAQIRHREMTIQRGHSYSVAFTAWASHATRVAPKVGMAGPPHKEYWATLIDLTPQKQRFVARFNMTQDDDPTAEFAFHAGGNLVKGGVPVTICVDEVRLDDPQFTPPPAQAAAEVPKVLVNQVGYVPSFDKWATVRSSSAEPLKWELIDASGDIVASGDTAPFGEDEASKDRVHLIDFSEHTQPGKGLTLQVGDDVSLPFDIAADLYKQLKYDALAYFYHNRSGIDISMPYAREERWARKAGHQPDQVACAPDAGCKYSLDVTGGWYDAGDHGKYVVNGGISLWTMLNQWERAKHLGGSLRDFADRKLNIPESGNGVDDLLDEARWQLEFMLKMQVPAGKPKAGMVHHKIHDDSWTALALAPADDPKTRHLRPVSTAATLNLAATAAQGARIWKRVDAAFAKRLVSAAERAWQAAHQFPDLLAKPEDKNGGGPYDDDYLKDEFYWAAVELFITTGDAEYKKALQSNPHHQRFKQNDSYLSIMTWKEVDALGVISLAVVPNQFGPAEQKRARQRLTEVADGYLNHISGQGYRLPFHPGPSWKYPWGSNSFVLNNMLVMALAHDFSKQDKYLHGVAEGFDYLLGRNPMGQSYISGYGERPLQNPHHRFWSYQADNSFPKAPPGCVSGGPNSGLEDPYAKAAGLAGCAPAKCFIDHIEAWSTNEITINWNAPLAWLAAFVDEKSKR